MALRSNTDTGEKRFVQPRGPTMATYDERVLKPGGQVRYIAQAIEAQGCPTVILSTPRAR